MAYIAGRAPATPVSVDVRRQGGNWTTRVIATRAGDGRVAWGSGQLSGVPTWYADTTNHRGLPKDSRLFRAIDNILTRGRTNDLPQRPAIASDESALFEANLPSSFHRLRGLVESYRNLAKASPRDCIRKTA